MPGLAFAQRKGTAFPTPLVGEALIGKSTEIHNGDVLVLTVNATYTANNIPVVRPLFSGDTVTTSNGLFGVALFDVQTDSNANMTTVSSPVTVSAQGKVSYQLPSIGFALPYDPATGYVRIYVALFDPQNVFAIRTQASDTANFYLLNRSLGINASAASAPATYTADDDAAAANAPVVCEGIDTTDPLFNSAAGGGRIFISCKTSFYARNISSGWFS